MTFADGVRAFTDAFGLLRARGIATFVWLPTLVSLAVIGSTLTLVFGYVDAGVAWVMNQVPSWLDFIEAILAPLAYLICIVIAAWLFGYVATLVSSPFLGFLSARTQRQETGASPAANLSVAATVLGTLLREVRKLAYHLPRLLLVFVITLLPIVNLAAPFVWFLFGAWTLAVQFVDYAPENEDASFKATLDVLKANRACALGFGAPTALAMAIPFVNFMVIPVAVIGGTLLWCRLKERGAPTPR